MPWEGREALQSDWASTGYMSECIWRLPATSHAMFGNLSFQGTNWALGRKGSFAE